MSSRRDRSREPGGWGLGGRPCREFSAPARRPSSPRGCCRRSDTCRPSGSATRSAGGKRPAAEETGEDLSAAIAAPRRQQVLIVTSCPSPPPGPCRRGVPPASRRRSPHPPGRPPADGRRRCAPRRPWAQGGRGTQRSAPPPWPGGGGRRSRAVAGPPPHACHPGEACGDVRAPATIPLSSAGSHASPSLRALHAHCLPGGQPDAVVVACVKDAGAIAGGRRQARPMSTDQHERRCVRRSSLLRSGFASTHRRRGRDRRALQVPAPPLSGGAKPSRRAGAGRAAGGGPSPTARVRR
jgi:hypothetical protein